MRKLKYHVATTADGFVAREDDSFDCFPTQGEAVDDYLASFATYDTVLMGRRTYEVGLRFGVTDPYPMFATYVCTRTMKESPNPRVKLVADDVAGKVRELKSQEGKDIYLCGGGKLASVLFAEGLIDEVLLKLNPLLLGKGIPLTAGLPSVLALELLSTRVYKNGVLLLRYAVMR